MIAAPPESPQTPDASTAQLPGWKRRRGMMMVLAILALGALAIGIIAAARRPTEHASIARGMATESALIATPPPGIPTPTPLANKPTPTPLPTPTAAPTTPPEIVTPPPVAPPPVVVAPIRQPAPAAPANAGGHGKGKGKGGHD